MGFEILDGPTDIETIAKGKGSQERARLRRAYGAVTGESAKAWRVFG